MKRTLHGQFRAWKPEKKSRFRGVPKARSLQNLTLTAPDAAIAADQGASGGRVETDNSPGTGPAGASPSRAT